MISSSHVDLCTLYGAQQWEEMPETRITGNWREHSYPEIVQMTNRARKSPTHYKKPKVMGTKQILHFQNKAFYNLK